MIHPEVQQSIEAYARSNKYLIFDIFKISLDQGFISADDFYFARLVRGAELQIMNDDYDTGRTDFSLNDLLDEGKMNAENKRINNLACKMIAKITHSEPEFVQRRYDALYKRIEDDVLRERRRKRT